MSNSRIIREITSYETGLKRDFWRIFKYAGYFENQYQFKLLCSEASRLGKNLRILELGSSKWKDFIYDNLGHHNIECISINISPDEISRSKSESLELNLAWYPQWVEMDAHNLSFPDDHFDLIFGFGMLHHLDMPVLFNSLDRVLKPGGVLFLRNHLISIHFLKLAAC